jgi:hypothetical protein
MFLFASIIEAYQEKKKKSDLEMSATMLRRGVGNQRRNNGGERAERREQAANATHKQRTQA